MLLTQLPLATSTYFFRITSTSIVVAPVKDTATQAIPGPVLPKKPVSKKKPTPRNPCDQPGSANVVEQEVHSLIKQGYVQQPCGTNVTVNGNVYIELGGGGNTTKSNE